MARSYTALNENPDLVGTTEIIMEQDTQNITLRPGTPDDAEFCGRICHEAFRVVAQQHYFPSESGTVEDTIADFARQLAHKDFYVLVAELNGRIVGSNVLDERSTITGLGPITVDPEVQNNMIGRQLMQAALQRATERQCSGVRLVYAAYNSRALCLYSKLGFDVREPLALVQGPALGLQIPGCTVRKVVPDDLVACNALCRKIHGHDRSGEVLDAIQAGTARLLEREQRITGYATDIGFGGHAVGECNTDLMALIAAAAGFTGAGFLLPIRNGELFRWCMSHGLRVVLARTLMSTGLYNEPQGSFLPSISY